MSIPRSSTRLAAITLCAASLAGACSRSGDLTSPSTSIPTTTVAPAAGTATVPSSVAPDTADDMTDTSDTSDTSDDTAPVSLETAPPISIVDVAEVGVPGLDSDDEFCSSWSRFAGSFQVVAVTAAFGSGPPEQLAALEVAAAPTVTSAYRQLVENWPDELAAEADLVADEFLGPFARRLEAARSALGEVGADDAAIAAIESAWLEGLAGRDPTTPEFVVDLSDDLWAVIDDAAAAFARQRVPFSQDPSLVTDVQTPLTSEYLAVSCPDQGTLSGQEVETP